MDQKRSLNQVNIRRYKELDRNIKSKCNKEKEKWLKSKCEKIKALKNKDMRNIYQEIRAVTGKKWCTSSGYICSKDGKIILEQVDILDRWTKYLEDLFDEERGDKLVIRKELA